MDGIGIATSNLPTGWTKSSLGEIAEYINGRAFKPAEWRKQGRPIVRIQNLNDPKATYNFSPENHEEKYLIKRGDLLFAWSASLGVHIWRGDEAWLNQHIFRVNPKPCVDKSFLYYLLQRITAELYAKTHGSGMVHITKGPFVDTEILLPPSAEQRRIVAKIEELFSELDRGVESLETAREQLKVYRQAILKHAFEGKLTSQWREENREKVKSGQNWRERILAKRKSEWEKAELERLKAKRSVPKNNDWENRYEEPAAFDRDDLPKLPKDWCWAGLDELVSGKPRSMQSGPFGSNLKHSEFQSRGVLVLGIDNVCDGFFSMGSENRISKEKFTELAKYEARPGDLLVTVMASLGRTCIVPRDLETAIITKHVYRISMEQDLLLPEFFNLVLQSETVSRRRMFKNAQGQTRPGLNSTILRALPMPLCSIAEQQEIVRRLDRELSSIEEFETDIDQELLRCNALRQSILKKAFSGQLVPQDANDEPASVLLERIEAEKAAQTDGAKKTKIRVAA